MRKLKFTLPFIVLGIGLFAVTGCKKTTTNNVVQKDSIYYSPWIKLAMSPTDNTDSSYYAQINASHVTAKVISTGAVISYFGEVGVPSSGDTLVTDLLYWNAFQFLSPGVIEIDSYGYLNDLSYSTSFPLLYRYVVIPGSILASTALQNMTQQQLQKMSFTDIQKLANTPAKQSSGNSVTP